MALSEIGNDLAALVLGEIVGGVSEEITLRIRLHRSEIGAPQTGPGSGTMDTLLDMMLDAFAEMIMLVLGIKVATAAIPAIEENISSMTFFIIGISTYTRLPSNMKKITNEMMKTPDTIIAPND